MESKLKSLNSKQVRIANLSDSRDIEYILTVLDNYKMDGMGQSPPFTDNERNILKEKFSKFPNVLVFLAFVDDFIAGGAVCFNTFSTFLTGDVVNIHDICVIKEFRGLGLGRDLMDSIISKSKNLDCSKVTLEVREDNIIAQKLYSSLEFKESNPPMKFWTKLL